MSLSSLANSEKVDSSSFVVQKLVIIGVGLMGGSLGLALRKVNFASEIVGIDTMPTVLEALKIGAIDRGTNDLIHEVANADLIVIATPVRAIPDVLTLLASCVSKDVLITDVAGVKSSISELGNQLLGERFIGGHPMAGSEQTGILAARSDLYQNAAWAIAPASDEVNNLTTGTLARIEILSSLIRAVGAHPQVVAPIRHDNAAALISHLPHVISFAYNRTVETDDDSSLARALAAGSYRDLTRITSSDPLLWRDIFLENRLPILQMICKFKSALNELEQAISNGTPDEVLTVINQFASKMT